MSPSLLHAQYLNPAGHPYWASETEHHEQFFHEAHAAPLPFAPCSVIKRWRTAVPDRPVWGHRWQGQVAEVAEVPEAGVKRWPYSKATTDQPRTVPLDLEPCLTQAPRRQQNQTL